MAATGWEAIGGRGRGGGVVDSYWMGGNRREGEGGEVVGSYWMGGGRREGERRGSGWQLLDGRQ